MSLFDDASLVLIPDGAKDGTLYSVKPTDGTGDFTFTRGSNLAATRVDENGLIEKGRENLLLQSNQFDTTWTTSNVSVTSGQSGYDGSSDAWLLTTSAVAGYINRAVVNSGVQTYSIYAKAGTETGLFIRLNGGSNPRCFFNLTNGLVGSDAGGVIKSSIEDVGGGWYRCSIACNDTSTDARVYVASAGGSFPSTGNIYIQDAQLEVGLVATDYIETGATTAQAGILEDLPRIDYSGGASCPALLLEPQRTNSVNHSELFSVSGGYWGNTRGSVESNSTTSPEGVVNASKLLQDPAESNSGLVNRTITASGSNTFSFYAKKGTKNFARLGLYSSVETSVYFDLENGTIGTTNLIAEADCFIEDMGNDWYRCGATYSGATNRFNIYIADRDGETTLLDSTDAYIYIYGAQWEASASYPTSYIPTYGTSVTRGADVCSKTGVSSLIGQSEGTVYFEGNLTKNSTAGFLTQISDGTNNNRVQISFDNNLYWQVTGNNSLGINGSFNFTDNALIKMAFAYKNGDSIFYINGVEATSLGKSSANVPLALNRIDFARNHTTNFPITSKIKNTILFKTRLTNSELAAITTL